MPFKVYTAEYHGQRNHVAMFVETSPTEGLRYHVTGTILAGMAFERKPSEQPEQDAEYVQGTKVYVGTVDEGDLDLMSAVCRTVPPPGKQVRLNGSRIDPSKPLYRCGEWLEDARLKLIEESVIKL